MGEVQTFTLNYKEVVEVLIKHQDLHEGIWQLYIEFGLGAANIPTGENQLSPAAIIPINKIGLKRVEAVNSLALDASKVNPMK